MKKQHITLKRVFNSIFARFFLGKKEFSISGDYVHRKSVPHFNDTENKDLWQDEVYSLAKLFLDKDNLKTVIDIGCGSGYKLLKYFKENDFYGFEVNPTFSFLQNNYPNNNWRNIESEDLSNYTADIVISSDVIEHIDNPIPYLENILKIKGVQYYFFSTPEKFSLYGKKDFGPPSNLHHFREWDSFEFNEFMSEFFDIKYHFMSNFEQNTQLIIAKRKNI